MKNYQKLSYQEYRIMLSDGSSIVTTRQECFSIEPASEGCPFKQRWYYSPDQYMAVRLPRNELGERLGKDNAADFKAQERLIARNRERNTEIDAYTTEDSVSFEIPDPDSVLFLHRLFTGKNTVRKAEFHRFVCVHPRFRVHEMRDFRSAHSGLDFIMLSLTSDSISIAFCISAESPIAIVIGLCIISIETGDIKTLFPAIAITLAALAAIPSIFTVTLPL